MNTEGVDHDVVILGAGLAGLSCGYELSRRGYRVLVLERENHVGGMAGSFEEGDRDRAGDENSDYFSYDFGPHRFHSDDIELLRHVEEMLGGNAAWQRRLSRIFLFDRFFNYPLELGNLLRQVPVAALTRILFDYVKARVLTRLGVHPARDRNFAEWVEARFGRSLAEMFFVEYTEKTWGIPATEISATWARQRISLLSLGDAILRTIFRFKSQPRTLVSRFVYPRVGGIGELARAYSRTIESNGGRVLLNAPVLEIARDGSRVTHVQFRHEGARKIALTQSVVSTIPVTAMVRLLRPRCPDDVRTAARELRHVSIVFIYLKIDKPSVTPDNWIYLPQKELTIHRISEFKNFSRLAAPKSRTLVCAEITCQLGGETWRASSKHLIDVATKDLERIGLIEARDVIDGFTRRIPFAYPIYDLHYEERLSRVMDFVHDFDNLETAGRQGLFRYNNMDQSIMMGRRLGTTLATGEQIRHEDVAVEQRYFG